MSGLVDKDGILYEDHPVIDNAALQLMLGYGVTAAGLSGIVHPLDDDSLHTTSQMIRTMLEPGVVGERKGVLDVAKFPHLEAQYQAHVAYALYIEALTGSPEKQDASLQLARELFLKAHNSITKGAASNSMTAQIAVKMSGARALALQKTRAQLGKDEPTFLANYANPDRAGEVAEKLYSFVIGTLEHFTVVPAIRTMVNRFLGAQLPGVPEDVRVNMFEQMCQILDMRDTGPDGDFMQTLLTGEHINVLNEAFLGRAKLRALAGDKAGVDAALGRINAIRATAPFMPSGMLDDQCGQLRHMKDGVAFIPQAPTSFPAQIAAMREAMGQPKNPKMNIAVIGDSPEDKRLSPEELAALQNVLGVPKVLQSA